MKFILLLAALTPLFAQQSKDEKEAIATVEKTFQGMKAHDAEMIRSTMLPDARLYAVRDAAAPGASRSVDEFVTQIVAASKNDLVERFTAAPLVAIHGRIAQVWGEYEFLRDGKFTHCGIDAVSLFKTPDGWKIATIVYTTETAGCKGH